MSGPLQEASISNEARCAELREQLAALEAERDRMAAERDSLAAERASMAAEKDGLAAERDRLAAEAEEDKRSTASLEVGRQPGVEQMIWFRMLRPALPLVGYSCRCAGLRFAHNGCATTQVLQLAPLVSQESIKHLETRLATADAEVCSARVNVHSPGEVVMQRK